MLLKTDRSRKVFSNLPFSILQTFSTPQNISDSESRKTKVWSPPIRKGIDMDYIKRMDAFGNTEGHPSNKAYSGDMVDGREIPKGCTPYTNPSHVPVYGSSTGEVEKVVEKKIKHNFIKKVSNFGSNYHR